MSDKKIDQARALTVSAMRLLTPFEAVALLESIKYCIMKDAWNEAKLP